ncbi:hypothetical protein J7K74_01720 [Candidatus Woesearchaeota archaeon]|nr:hypothetical protein [Candidatus Woesearchaeota archaeon]
MKPIKIFGIVLMVYVIIPLVLSATAGPGSYGECNISTSLGIHCSCDLFPYETECGYYAPIPLGCYPYTCRDVYACKISDLNGVSSIVYINSESCEGDRLNCDYTFFTLDEDTCRDIAIRLGGDYSYSPPTNNYGGNPDCPDQCMNNVFYDYSDDCTVLTTYDCGSCTGCEGSIAHYSYCNGGPCGETTNNCSQSCNLACYSLHCGGYCYPSEDSAPNGCMDGVDNDNDGLIDLLDTDCSGLWGGFYPRAYNVSSVCRNVSVRNPNTGELEGFGDSGLCPRAGDCLVFVNGSPVCVPLGDVFSFNGGVFVCTEDPTRGYSGSWCRTIIDEDGVRRDTSIDFSGTCIVDYAFCDYDVGSGPVLGCDHSLEPATIVLGDSNITLNFRPWCFSNDERIPGMYLSIMDQIKSFGEANDLVNFSNGTLWIDPSVLDKLSWARPSFNYSCNLVSFGRGMIGGWGVIGHTVKTSASQVVVDE